MKATEIQVTIARAGEELLEVIKETYVSTKNLINSLVFG